MGETSQTSPKPKARVFINYRREDASGYAGRLYAWLSHSDNLGPSSVFMDVSTIRPGMDFVKAIEEVVTACDVMLVLIGQEWLDCCKRRLADPEDFVRYEITLALSLNKLVIPVCVDRASVPRPEDLPDVLKPLVRRHALELTNERWEYDAGRLLATIKEETEGPEPGDDPDPLADKGGQTRGGWRRLFGLRRYWELFHVRLLAGLLVLSAALAPQVHLAYRPEPVSLEVTGKFSPAAAKLGREVLRIEAPSPDAEGLLLAHVANADEIVDLVFESARLDGNTLMLFSEQNPPTRPSRVDFLTTKPGAAAAGEPCRTFIQVRAADPRSPPSALHFSQPGVPGGDVLRALELKADGDVLVGVDTDMPDESDERSPGCAKLLKVAPDFASPVSGLSTISVVAEATSAARFSFNPATAKGSLLGEAKGLFEPFSFGNNVPAVLRARAVEIVAPGGNAAGPAPVLGARSVDGGEPLSIESLSVGSDHLQVKVSGVGFVKVNGEDYTDPLGYVKRHPLPSLLLVLADAALLALVAHMLFGRRQPSMLR